MPQILFLGTQDALHRSRRMLLKRAGLSLAPETSVKEAVTARSWTACVLTIIGTGIPESKRQQLRKAIEHDGCRCLDLHEAFLRHGLQGRQDVGPATLLEIVGEAVMAAHQHNEIDGDNVAYVDAERRYIQVTDGFLKIVGYRRDEILGMKIDDLTYPGTADTARQFHRYLADGRQAGRYFLRHKSGRRVTVEFEAGVLPDGCMYSNITPTDDEN